MATELERQDRQDNRERWHWFWLEVVAVLSLLGVGATAVGVGITVYQVFWINPALELKQRQKEFALTIFNEKKNIYFEIMDLMAQFYDARTEVNAITILNKLSMLMNGRYRLVMVDNPADKQNIFSATESIEKFYSVAFDYITKMKQEDIKEKYIQRYHLLTSKSKVENGLRKSLSVNFPDLKDGNADGLFIPLPPTKEQEEQMKQEMEGIAKTWSPTYNFKFKKGEN